MKNILKTTLLILSICIVSTTLVSCAKANSSDPGDPYQSYNRKMFAFNNAVDAISLRPLAIIYVSVTPDPVQKGITNIFNNFEEPTNVIDDLFQAKGAYALNDFWRLVINSTVGVAGLFDVAKHCGLPPHTNDFGITLAQWSSYKKSNFFMTPLLGPNTIRGGFAQFFDFFVFSDWFLIKPPIDRYIALTLWITNLRAQLLPVDPLIADAFDPYTFVKNAYLQRRNKQIQQSKLSYHQFRKNYYENINSGSQPNAWSSKKNPLSPSSNQTNLSNQLQPSKPSSKKQPDDDWIFNESSSS